MCFHAHAIIQFSISHNEGNFFYKRNESHYQGEVIVGHQSIKISLVVTGIKQGV